MRSAGEKSELHEVFLEVGECALIFFAAKNGVGKCFARAIKLYATLFPPHILSGEIKEFEPARDRTPERFLVSPLPRTRPAYLAPDVPELFGE